MSHQRRFAVVVGCGRLGAMLAVELSRRGHHVVAIDSRPAAFERLTIEFSGFTLEGDGGELALLREAKADRADLLLAVTGDDNLNLMIAQIATRVLRVPRVMARLSHPDRAPIFEVLGVSAVNPNQLACDQVLRELDEQNAGER